jgi:hypothetical protein
MNATSKHNDISTAVLVFKTNIESEQDVLKIAPFLNNEKAIRRWNADLEDVDHILRIESADHNAERFIALIAAAGFDCKELPD